MGTWQTRSSENDDVVFKAVEDALKSGYRMFGKSILRNARYEKVQLPVLPVCRYFAFVQRWLLLDPQNREENPKILNI